MPALTKPDRVAASGVEQPTSAAHRKKAKTGRISQTRCYSGSMPWTTGLLLFFATIAVMEGVAYVAHRWIMHGFGWFLHESHHRPRTGNWELNDWYAVIFALPSIMLLVFGVTLGWWPGFIWIGAGIAGYGAIYFGFHDIIVHRRIPTRYLPKSAYMKRIIQAHRLHHVIETKHGTVSYGFLIAPKPEDLKAEIKRRQRAGMRAPAASVEQARN